MEELYKQLKELDNGINILIVKKTIFGFNAKLFLDKRFAFDGSKYRNRKKYIIYKF